MCYFVTSAFALWKYLITTNENSSKKAAVIEIKLLFQIVFC